MRSAPRRRLPRRSGRTPSSCPRRSDTWSPRRARARGGRTPPARSRRRGGPNSGSASELRLRAANADVGDVGARSVAVLVVRVEARLVRRVAAAAADALVDARVDARAAVVVRELRRVLVPVLVPGPLVEAPRHVEDAVERRAGR